MGSEMWLLGSLSVATVSTPRLLVRWWSVARPLVRRVDGSGVRLAECLGGG